MLLTIGLIGFGVLAVITLVVMLVIRRKRRIADNLPVWYPLKHVVTCPFCQQLNYIRRKDVHYFCTKCWKSVEVK